MIMYPFFVQCCRYTQNSQLIYILIKISKGIEFRYNNFNIEIDSSMLKIKNGKTITKYSYSKNKSPEKIIQDLYEIFNLSGDYCKLDSSKEYTIKDYMFKDYVVNCINNNIINKNSGSELLNYIIICQIFKIFSTKDRSEERRVAKDCRTRCD